MRVPSLTRADGKEWLVTIYPDRPWICSCPAFDNSKARPKTCKHIDLVKRAQRLEAWCAERHGTEGGGVCSQCLVSLMAGAARKVRRNYVPKTAMKGARRDGRKRQRKAKP